MEHTGNPVDITQILSSLTQQVNMMQGVAQTSWNLPARYALPLSLDNCYRLISLCYSKTVLMAGGNVMPSERLSMCLKYIAQKLVNPEAKWGLLLTSSPGCGKTTMVRAIQQMLNILKFPDPLARPAEIRYMGLKIVGARDVNRLYVDDHMEFMKYAGVSMLAIDDLGVDTTEKFTYGQSYYPVNELIEYRYSRQLYTVITTNLMPEDLENRFGSRCWDRIKEMCYRVGFGDENDSFRTKKDTGKR